MGPYLLPHIIRDLREHFPKLEFYLYEHQTRVLLKRLEEGLDCLVLAELEGMEGLAPSPLSGTLWLAVPQHHPEGRGAKAVPCTISRAKKLLMLADGHCLRDQAMGFCFAAASVDRRGHQSGDACATWSPGSAHDAGAQARRARQPGGRGASAIAR